MRCSFLVLMLQLTFAGVLFAAVADGQALQEKVTLSLNNATVAQSLVAIENNSSVKFSVRERLVNAVLKSVTINARNQPVKQVLDDVLAHTGLQYKLVEGYVIIEPVPAPVRVTGKVIDSKTQETLPGVSVRVKNGAGGALTDANGAFAVTIPAETGTLVFSYIGYETAEVAVDRNSQNIVVKLKPSSRVLNEVVVQARRNTRTEMAVLDERKRASIIQDGISAQQIERTASITTTQALQRVSGVTISDDKYVAIRGLGDRSVYK